MSATGPTAKALKEAEVEEATRRAYESGYDVTVIDGDDFAAALQDPKVHALHERAQKLAADLVKRGHCPCHLVVNCPNAEIQ